MLRATFEYFPRTMAAWPLGIETPAIVFNKVVFFILPLRSSMIRCLIAARD